MRGLTSTETLLRSEVAGSVTEGRPAAASTAATTASAAIVYIAPGQPTTAPGTRADHHERSSSALGTGQDTGHGKGVGLERRRAERGRDASDQYDRIGRACGLENHGHQEGDHARADDDAPVDPTGCRRDDR
jgi:hypothetical protein